MALLKIYDDIANENQAVGFFGDVVSVFSADRLSTFVQETEDKEIDARVHCMGGSVSEGYACLDILSMSGKKVSVTVEGLCASIATVLLFAAPIDRRKIYPNARLMIHNPYIPEFTLAGSYESKELAKLAADLEAEENRLLDLYVKNTKATREQLKAMMDAETYINAQLAVELGFVSEILQPSMNRATLLEWSKNHKSNNMENKEFIAKLDKQETLLNKLLKKFGLLSAVALVLTDSTGAELTLEKESGDPMVGDAATPDGTFVMDDGTTIVVLDGAITEITPKAEDTNAEMEALKTEIADLKKQIADSETAKAAAIETAVNAKVTEATVEAVALVKELKSIKSTFKPETRAADTPEPKLSVVQQRLNQYKK